MCRNVIITEEPANVHPSAEGWKQIATLDLTSRAADYFPILLLPLQFDSMFDSVNQLARVTSFELREYYASGSGIDLAMQWHLYSTAAPTSPVITPGTTYEAPLGNWIGTIEIASADYKRMNSSNRYVRITDPTRLPIIKNGSTSVTSIFAVGTSNNDAYDYAANAEIWVRILTSPLGL